MKKISIIILAIMLITTLSVGLMACDIGGGGSDAPSGDLGKFYLVEDGELVQDSYIELQVGGKWTDGEFSGTYKLDGTTITFFVDGEEFFGGTFSGGVLRTDIMGIEQEYRKTAPQSSIGSDQVDNKAKITAIQGGTVDGLTLNLELGDTVEDVDLSGMITTSKDCSWQLYTSRTATAADAIVTKMIVPKNGANTFYIVVTSSDGKINRTYTLNVWKNYFATLSFYVDDVLYDTDEVLTHTTYGAGPSYSVDGYEFQGWGCQGHYVVGDASFDATLTPCQYTVAFDANGGEDVSSKTVTYGDSTWLPSAYRTGYTFLGWYYGQLYNDSMKYTFPRNITMTAKWQINSYNVKTISEDTKKGTVTEINEEKSYGSSVNLQATTKTGYTFIGWYDGITKISDELNYTTTVPAYNVTYTAKWIQCPVTLTKNISSAGTVRGINETILGQDTTISAVTNSGYTWVGWFDGDTKLTDSMSYTFTITTESKTYIAKWSKVTLEKNNASAGSVGGLDRAYKVGDSTTITATTNNGYTWLGWYDGDTKLTEEQSYTFVMTVNNKKYTAKWSKVTLSINNTAAGSVGGLDRAYKVGDIATITATTYIGYNWIGWYEGTKKLTDELSYTITMTTEDKTYTAKWEVKEEMNNFIFTSTANSCVIKGIKDKQITEIIIPQGVTKIDIVAISRCLNLTSVNICADNVTLDMASFYQCPNLSNVTISAYNVTLLGGCFDKCENLSDVTVLGSIGIIAGSGNIFSKTIKNLYYPSLEEWININFQVDYYGNAPLNNVENLYFGGELVVDLVIPESVAKINSYAFAGYEKLKSVVTTNAVDIEAWAFGDCKGLISVTIGEEGTATVGSIGLAAFNGCGALTNITINCFLSSIGDSWINYSPNFSYVTFNKTMSDWQSISKGSPFLSDSPTSITVYCTDGTIIED